MDVNRSYRGCRDTSSPDRAKICRLKQKVLKQQPSRKVQVVYYLSRNGLLEHPHFMEVTLSASQPLRLKDVFDRLMALRGSGMPSQYSWSSKRNYKSGYVWYDLALKDIIHPSEGGEYVLKGSELVEGLSERFQQLNVGNKQAIHQQPEQNYSYNNAKSKALFSGDGGQQKEAEPEDQYEEYEEQEKEYEDGEKTSYTSSTTTPHSRCSRGVSTEELDEEEHVDAAQNNNKTKAVTTTTNRISAQSHSHVTHAPPPRDPSNSSNSTTTLAEKLNQRERRVVHHSKRFGEGSTESGAGSNTGVGVGVTSAAPSRYSVLLQLIACGSGISSSSGAEIKAKSQEARLSNVGTNNKQRESVDDDAHDHQLQKQKKKKKPLGDNTDDEMMHYCVSENPRLLRNLQSEEKEYFSGSLVESMKANRVAFEAHPVLLKRSNSYNEERRSKLEMEEVKRREMEEDKRETKGGVREKCIPLKKSSKESRK